jgi:hypothetical protein
MKGLDSDKAQVAAELAIREVLKGVLRGVDGRPLVIMGLLAEIFQERANQANDPIVKAKWERAANCVDQASFSMLSDWEY